MPKLLFLLLLTTSTLLAQDTTDVARLSQLRYMQDYAEIVDCENWEGDNLSHRVCLNKEFQTLDARMNHQLIQYWTTVKSDSLLQEEQQYHQAWVAHRRRLADQAADGYRGHLLGIIYLMTMNEITRQRITELSFLLGTD